MHCTSITSMISKTIYFWKKSFNTQLDRLGLAGSFKVGRVGLHSGWLPQQTSPIHDFDIKLKIELVQQSIVPKMMKIKFLHNPFLILKIIE